MYDIANPSADLIPHIKKFWGMRSDFKEGIMYHHKLIPTGMIEMTFYFNTIPVYQMHSSKKSIRANCIISGQQEEPMQVEIDGPLDLFSILFHPAGIQELIPVPAIELGGNVFDLTLLPKHNFSVLAEKLADCMRFEDRVALCEKFFRLQIQQKKLSQHPSMPFVMNTFMKSRGNIDLSVLIEESCLSRKQFERHFSSSIGVSPGKFRRILRFQYALYLKSTNPDMDLTSLATDAGYFDQAHMIREFRTFSSLTPRKFFNTCLPVSDLYNH
jgi:AraC-like DNA-binding protein